MSKRIKVLMVDDEERFRTATAKILSRKGFDTIVAESGEQALEKLADEPDVVILDVKMGGLDGHETLRIIKERKPSLPVIMLTGHGAMPSAKKALETGAYDYLAKPCDIELLASRINDATQSGGTRAYVEKTVGNIMISLEDYTTITSDSTIADALAALREAHQRLELTDRLMDTGHRSVLVLENGRIIGLLAPLDLIAGVLPDYLNAPKPSMADSLQYSALFWTGLFTTRVKEIMKRKVRDLMSDTPPTIDADANLMEAAYTMTSTGRRRLIVFWEGREVGVVREQELFYELARINSLS